MTDFEGSRVLTINSGSSSLKAASYETGEKEARILAVEV
jgi:acetate kinase